MEHSGKNKPHNEVLKKEWLNLQKSVLRPIGEVPLKKSMKMGYLKAEMDKAVLAKRTQLIGLNSTPIRKRFRAWKPRRSYSTPLRPDNDQIV